MSRYKNTWNRAFKVHRLYDILHEQAVEFFLIANLLIIGMMSDKNIMKYL